MEILLETKGNPDHNINLKMMNEWFQPLFGEANPDVHVINKNTQLFISVEHLIRKP